MEQRAMDSSTPMLSTTLLTSVGMGAPREGGNWPKDAPEGSYAPEVRLRVRVRVGVGVGFRVRPEGSYAPEVSP